MLHENAISREDQAVQRSITPSISNEELVFNQLRQIVSGVMAIHNETLHDAPDDELINSGVPGMTLESRLVATFEGVILLDTEVAYEQLDPQLAPTDHLAIFRPATANPDAPVLANAPHVIQIIKGRVHAGKRSWWPNLALFIATLFSVLLVGTEMAIQQVAQRNILEARNIYNNLPFELWRGLPYALSLLLILGAHELGHYFAARRHKLDVTLPYFIPMPIISMFGTMGAFIQLRQPMRNRKTLLDVGAAGPLAGLVFAVPILLIGLANADTMPLPKGPFIYEGDSILYATAKILTFGHFLPDGVIDVNMSTSQMAWAGWTGLLVTSLNLIPIGQLDGGHVMYALIGDRARKLYYPLLAIMIGLVVLTNVWFIWVMLLLFFGRVYATPLDTITPLDKPRKIVAVVAMIAFVLIFVPAPLSETARFQSILPGARDSALLLPLLLPAIVAGVLLRPR